MIFAIRPWSSDTLANLLVQMFKVVGGGSLAAPATVSVDGVSSTTAFSWTAGDWHVVTLEWSSNQNLGQICGSSTLEFDVAEVACSGSTALSSGNRDGLRSS